MRASMKPSTWVVALSWSLALLTPLGCKDQSIDGWAPPPIDSPSAVVDALSRAYQQRDDQLLAGLLANDPDHDAEYLFILSDPTPDNETSWGYTAEARLHQRMFHPESPLPGDTPADPDLWLQNLTIALTPKTTFSERTDLYLSHGGCLDEEKWHATAAVYTTYLLFELAGDTNYRIDGEADFVVIEDLTKDIGDDGKFLLLIWEDLGSGAPFDLASSKTTWGAMKDLYR